MVFAIANQEMAVFGPLDSGAMRRFNYEVRFRHAGVKRHLCYGPGITWVGVADNIDLEISTLPYPLQEPPALTVVTEVVFTEVAGAAEGFFALFLVRSFAAEMICSGDPCSRV